MRSRSPEPPDDALTRRWEQLRAELARASDAAVPPDPVANPVAGPVADPVADPAAGPVPDPAPAEADWWAGHTRLAPRRALPGLAGADLDDALGDAQDDAHDGASHVDGPDHDGAEPEAGGDEADAWRVPVPGRHASRRAVRDRPDPGGWVRARLGGVVETGEALGRARGLLGPGPVAVVAVLVCLGLAWACWSMMRAEPVPVSAPIAVGGEPPGVPLSPSASGGAAADAGAAAGSAAGSGPAAATSGAAGASPSGRVTVDVAGRVRRPGIAVLPAGSRVVDALKAAGGARGGVDLSSLNLARVLVDGEQILVGRPAPVGSVAGPAGTGASGGGGAPASGALLDLNTATAEQLEALPQVGPVTAQSILAWRTEHGAFASVDELLEVDGIGDATLRQIAPLVTV